MSDTRLTTDDALLLIHERNFFYKKKYHLILGVCALALVVICVLTGMMIYVVKHPAHPLYFVTDKAGRFIQDIPAQQPNMTTADVALWAVHAVESTYTYDFVNYRSQLQDAQKYFTDYGWRNYMKGLQTSNNLVALTQRKMIVTAKVVSSPKLDGEGLAGKANIYTWKFEMPVLVTYASPPYDAKSTFSNSLLVSVIVQRQNALSSDNGLGIVQLIGTLVTGEPTGDLVAPS